MLGSPRFRLYQEIEAPFKSGSINHRYSNGWDLEEKRILSFAFALRMAFLLVFLLVLLPPMVCKSDRCSMHNPHTPYHKYHHLGDLMVGGIVSQAAIVFKEISLTKPPPSAMPGDFM